MKLLTVSIAAYNVEKYLEETLKSLTDKRYVNDLEVLVVDDGSKDKTGEIAIVLSISRRKMEVMAQQSIKE